VVVVRLVVLVGEDVVGVLDDRHRECLPILRLELTEPDSLPEQVGEMNQPRGRGVVVPRVLVLVRMVDLRVLLDPIQIDPGQHLDDPGEEIVRRLCDQDGVGEDEAVQEEGVLVALQVRLIGPIDRRIEVAKLTADPEETVGGLVDLTWR
jgi:hypothetical protein